MKYTCSLLICAFLVVTTQSLPTALLPNSSYANPEVTASCFNLYLPTLNEIANTFSTNFQACITVASEKTQNLTTEAEQSLAAYKQDANQFCNSFTICDQATDVISSFNCYANASTNDISLMYGISTQAANSANTLLNGIRAIQQLEYQCTNSTEEAYVRDTASTYELLNDCLKNGAPDVVASSAASTVASTVADNAQSSSAASPPPDDSLTDPTASQTVPPPPKTS